MSRGHYRVRRTRRGVAILIVLTMISVALAVSYAMLRTQTVTRQVQSNHQRSQQARNAAMAGLAAAVRTMHQSTWKGVDTQLTGTLSATQRYTVRFQPGDTTLQPSNPSDRDWHRRVTVISEGMALHTNSAANPSTCEIQAVMQLVPRALGAQPPRWAASQNYTFYQTGNDRFRAELPMQIVGPSWLQGEVRLGDETNWSSSIRNRYFSDLNEMRTGRNAVQQVDVRASGGSFRLSFRGASTSNLAYNASASTVQTALRGLATIGNPNVTVTGSSGGPYTVTFVNTLGASDVPALGGIDVSLTGTLHRVVITVLTTGIAGYVDCRPFTDTVSVPSSALQGTYQNLIESLGITINRTSSTSAMSPPIPTTFTSYRLYTGGPTYYAPQVPSTLRNTVLTPDPASNPLGVFFCATAITLQDNVTINGTLIGGQSITLDGKDIILRPPTIWSLDKTLTSGSTVPLRLPAMVARQTLRAAGALSAKVEGLVIAGETFQLDEGPQGASLTLAGRLLTNEFRMRRRNEWNQSALIWNLLYSLFSSQASSREGTPYFPIYLAGAGVTPVPSLTIRQEAGAPTDHWQDLTGPLYVPHTSDGGLRWDVVRMGLND